MRPARETGTFHRGAVASGFRLWKDDMEYEQFIEGKHFKQIESGFSYKCRNPNMRDYQRASVEWALARGKAAIFKDTGLGKTIDELEFADAVVKETKKPVLLLAPLAVGGQIASTEAPKFGYNVKTIRSMADVEVTTCITNYENLHNIDFEEFGGIVLDESSILKGLNGKIRQQITEGASGIPYKLSCTATPAPNDMMEIGSQSEFLGIMTQTEMLATFFVHDGGETSKWRLKGHGKRKFYEWMSTWAVIMRDPSDYGFSPLPDLPPLNVHHIEIETEPTGGLFPDVAQTMLERIAARRDTLEDRCKKAAAIANNADGPVLLWCNLNAEGDALERLIPDSVQVAGADKDEDKVDRLVGFATGKYRVLITKPKVAGFGMNWQHCNTMAFVGLSDSFEQYYQAVRRCWRQGQTRDVDVYVVAADVEGAVVENIRRKQKMADRTMAEMSKLASTFFAGFDRAKNELRQYKPSVDAPMPLF